MLIIVGLLLLAGALLGAGGPAGLGRLVARRMRRAVPGAWRPGAGVLAVALAVLALAALARGAWEIAAPAGVVALGLALSARRRPGPRPTPSSLSRREACDLLGVAPDATEPQIRAAHARLIKLAHPDRGGAVGLAAQLNAARDALLAG